MTATDDLRKLGKFPAVEAWQVRPPWDDARYRDALANSAIEELAERVGVLSKAVESSEACRQKWQARAERAEERLTEWKRKAHGYLTRAEQAEADVARLKGYARMTLDELGAPDETYPAPVANAVEFLNECFKADLPRRAEGGAG